VCAQTLLPAAGAGGWAACAAGGGGVAVAVLGPVGPPERLVEERVSEAAVRLVWRPPAAGPLPAAYRVSVTCANASACGADLGIEVRAGPDVNASLATTAAAGGAAEVRATLTNVSARRGYIFRAYPRAAADSAFGSAWGGPAAAAAAAGRFSAALYAPWAPATGVIYPTATPDPATLAYACPPPACTGTSLQVTWLAALPDAPAAAPPSYRLTAQRLSAPGGPALDPPPAAEAVVGDAPHAGALLKTLTAAGLARGALVRLRVYARSPAAAEYHAPAAAAVVRPISPPAPPGNVTFAVQDNDRLAVRCLPPADSGDGTPTGVPLVAYRLQYRPAGTAQWTTLPLRPAGPGGADFLLDYLRKAAGYEFMCAVSARQV
jgi:hypothetical protein